MELKAGYKQTEVGVIPEQWGISTIGAEFKIELGKMLDAEKNSGTPKPFLGNKAVQWGSIDISDLGLIKMNPNELPRYRLQQGDLLVCEGGEVGRSAIWNSPLEECYYQKALHRLRPKNKLSPQFIQYILQWYAGSGFLQNYATQTSIAHLPKDKFETIPVPAPSGEEQQAIASALSDADELIESLEQLLAKKRNLKQGAMQELLSGRSRINGFSKKWEPVTLSDCATFIKGKGLTKDDIGHFDEVPCIHYGELFTKYSAIISFVQNKTTDFNGSVRSKANDVLMPTSDVTPRGLAKSSCLTMSDVIIGGDVLIIRPDAKKISGEFLSYTIRNEEEQILQLVTGSTVFHLYGSDMKKFKINLPEVSEQTAIAAILSDMDADITALETQLAKARQIKQGMMQELLTGRIRLV